MTEGYFTMGDLERAIQEYNNLRSERKHLNLSEEKGNELLTKINSIEKQLVDQKITPQKVKEQGTFTDEFTTKHGSSFTSQLPMDFIKENHVYFPTFFNNTLMVGIEVIIPVLDDWVGGSLRSSRGALCYLQFPSTTEPMRLAIAAIKDNGWSAYAKADKGIYILGLNRFRLLNWDKIPWGDLK